jgi:hypothetical protein
LKRIGWEGLAAAMYQQSPVDIIRRRKTSYLFDNIAGMIASDVVSPMTGQYVKKLVRITVVISG